MLEPRNKVYTLHFLDYCVCKKIFTMFKLSVSTFGRKCWEDAVPFFHKVQYITVISTRLRLHPSYIYYPLRFERKESEVKGLGRHDMTVQQRARSIGEQPKAIVEVCNHFCPLVMVTLTYSCCSRTFHWCRNLSEMCYMLYWYPCMKGDIST